MKKAIFYYLIGVLSVVYGLWQVLSSQVVTGVLWSAAGVLWIATGIIWGSDND